MGQREFRRWLLGVTLIVFAPASAWCDEPMPPSTRLAPVDSDRQDPATAPTQQGADSQTGTAEVGTQRPDPAAAPPGSIPPQPPAATSRARADERTAGNVSPSPALLQRLLEQQSTLQNWVFLVSAFGMLLLIVMVAIL